VFLGRAGDSPPHPPLRDGLSLNRCLVQAVGSAPTETKGRDDDSSPRARWLHLPPPGGSGDFLCLTTGGLIGVARMEGA